MEMEIVQNPHRDYSNIVYNLNNRNDANNLEYFNKNLIEFQSVENDVMSKNVSTRSNIKDY